jgi:ribosomal protein S18 acetylase RimI-like enzyme
METVQVLTTAERPIAPEDVVRLYSVESWWPERRAEQVAAVLDRLPAVGAWRDDRLVGFARAITDGYIHAYLDDVVVDPDERHRGIGTALVRRLTELLRETVSIRTLFCAPELAAFYEAAGYRRTRQVVLHHADDV